MKKYIFTLFAAGLAMASCSVEDINKSETNDTDQVKKIYASIEGETKTSLGPNEEGTYKMFWSEGDQILVGNEKGDAYFTTEADSTSSAEFVLNEDSHDLDFADGVIAGYPVEGMYISSSDPEDIVYLTLPSVQKYVEGTFDNNVMPMISDVATDIHLKFNNAAGVLKLMLSAEEEMAIKSVVVDTYNEYISGECGYIPATKEYYFDDTTLAKQDITLDCGEGVAIGNEAKPFYIVAPHQEYTALTITVYTTDGYQQTFVMKSDRTLEVKRSTVLNIPLHVDDLTEIGGSDPEDPEDPENPENPENPEDPENPENPEDPENPENPEDPEDPENPEDPTEPSVTLTLGEVSMTDFSFSLEIKNADSYFYGIQPKTSFDNEFESGEFLEKLSYATAVESPLSYNGSIFNFQQELKEDFTITPGEEYVLWIVICDGDYTNEDIHSIVIKIPAITGGGSNTVDCSWDDSSMTSLMFTLSSSGAKFIYWALINEDDADNMSAEEKIELLLSTEGRKNVIEGARDIAPATGLRPGRVYVLIAVAIDSNGNYGELFEGAYNTNALPYNESLKVEINKSTEDGNLTWNLTEGEAVKYRYFLENTSLNSWLTTCGEDYTYVEERMYLEPGYYRYHETAETSVAAELKSGEEYVFIVVAVDADGNISHADHWIFTY